jgi:predicted MFS family arabinose efflux permease
MKKQVINPVVAIYLTFSGLFSFALAFFFATYVPFLVEKGMNLWQINVINSFFMLFIVLAEMPTGSFADRFGRHHSITLSCFLLMISFLIYYFSNSFLLFILAEIIGAIGHTFVSGAAEAWLVDSLKTRDEFHLKAEVFRQELTSKSIGVMAGCVFGSWLGDIDLSLPWLATAFFMFVAGLFSFIFIKENYKTETKEKTKSSLNKEVIEACRSLKNKELLYVMSFGAIIACSVQAMNMQWPLVFKDSFSFTSSYLGYLFVFISMAVALGGRLSKKTKSLFKNEKLLLIIPQLVTAIAIIITSRSSGLFMVTGAFLLHEVGRGMFTPVKQDYINNRIESKNRATVLSLESMFTKLGAFIGLIVSGFLANGLGISSTWLFSGIFLFIGVIFFFIIIKKPVAAKTP